MYHIYFFTTIPGGSYYYPHLPDKKNPSMQEASEKYNNFVP